MQIAPPDTKREVIIDYTNWRGERTVRGILPISISFESNKWHPEMQWLLEAVDMRDGIVKTFAMKNIHSWK